MYVLLDTKATHGYAPIQQQAQATSSLAAHWRQRAWHYS